MPGRGRSRRGITSKDYQQPLRRPGEKQETTSTAQDGAKDSSSALSESEKVNDPPLEEPAHDKQAEDTGTSQDSEEKLLKASEQKESEESDVSPQKTEVVNTTLSEGKEESIVNTSTKIEKNDEKAAEQKSAVLKTTTRQQADKITKLSPLAAEFIPKTGYNLQSLVEAPEFVPKSFSQQGQRPPMLRQLSDKPENELMNCVKDVLFGLTQTPGELDSYVETLVKMLQKWLSSLDSLQEIVDLIFDYSITEPNFQYMAAKLCNLLSEKDKKIVTKKSETFRSVFLTRCKDEHIKREATLQNTATKALLLGFAIFEAELFCNYRPLGESHPLKVFHRGLIEMLNTLLQNHSEDCLKCIGKILKMTGFLLDDPQFFDEKDRKEKVDKVFNDVNNLSKDASLSESVRELLSKVMELRASNWGSGTSEGAVGNYPVYPSDDGYYYSDYPLGMDELSLQDDLTPVTNPDQWSDYCDDVDEPSRMQETYKYYFPDQYNDDDEYYVPGDDSEYYVEEDPEFDDEINEEFEKFLQEQEGLFN
ncbi:polyadenylate-binding protein-interacting protein 1-like [Porites lutea]|uniref:polyadenylate-binding protein-interacting protein 1-like n=1 Tax=Porites lutea TaxID=51062 RepID=UPI003CC538E9